MTGLEILNCNVQIRHEWIDELDVMFGRNGKGRSYHLLRVQTLRKARTSRPLPPVSVDP